MTSPNPSEVSLNCWLITDEDSFSVKINPNQTVNDFKGVTNAMKSSLKEINLGSVQFSLTNIKDDANAMQHLKYESSQVLRRTLETFTVFKDGLSAGLIRIAVIRDSFRFNYSYLLTVLASIKFFPVSETYSGFNHTSFG